MKTTLNIDWNNTDWSVASLNGTSDSTPGNGATRSSPGQGLVHLPQAGELATLLARARRDAEALAWTTSHPELVLPLLVEEKVAEAKTWWARQEQICARSGRLLHAFEPAFARLAA